MTTTQTRFFDELAKLMTNAAGAAQGVRREIDTLVQSQMERLLNNMMRTEVYTGKKMKAYRVTKDAFDVIAERTKKNPVQVLVEALENAAPREEITRLQFGGISVPKAVDIAPSRRLDIALRNISKGAIQASFKTTKPIELCLADELILASKNDMNSFSVAKKEEVERVAQSAR
jgi:small subunit ribosomal protein S7